MLYPFNSDAQQIDPEKRKRFLQERMLNAENPVLGTTEMLLGMANAIPQQRPERMTVSGSSVIGMTPEQTTALLDRVARQNEVEANINQQEKARQDRRIEGYGERVFRARELEQQRQMRAAEREDDRAFQQQQLDAQRAARAAERAEDRAYEKEQGVLRQGPDGGLMRAFVDETGAWKSETIAPGREDVQIINGVAGTIQYDTNGKPTGFAPVAGAPPPRVAGGRGGGGGGGENWSSNDVYAFEKLVNAGASPESAAQAMGKALPPGFGQNRQPPSDEEFNEAMLNAYRFQPSEGEIPSRPYKIAERNLEKMTEERRVGRRLTDEEYDAAIFDMELIEGDISSGQRTYVNKHTGKYYRHAGPDTWEEVK